MERSPELKKKVTLQLNFDASGSYKGKLYPLPSEPTNLKGLRMEVFDDEYFPNGSDDPISTGRTQIHISGTPFALGQLGQFLLAVARNSVPCDFITHLEPIQGGRDGAGVHLVVHQKYRRSVGRTMRVL